MCHWLLRKVTRNVFACGKRRNGGRTGPLPGYQADAVRDAYVGSYATAHMLYGVLVAVAFTALAVTVGTGVFRTAGA
ncbi:hypothetical protein GCM10022384_27690 [Streptomyces marokkonensis]|uniref:Uncharacterized protein n=1 Tax=Streptomyces marokkonensis TaxID=324855 RepID=A0ABP7Q4G4_9ACTN